MLNIRCLQKVGKEQRRPYQGKKERKEKTSAR